jgi:hypothetical protein
MELGRVRHLGRWGQSVDDAHDVGSGPAQTPARPHEHHPHSPTLFHACAHVRRLQQAQKRGHVTLALGQQLAAVELRVAVRHKVDRHGTLHVHARARQLLHVRI